MPQKNKTPPTTLEGLDMQSLAPRILELLNGVQQLELENFSMEIGDLDLFIPSQGFSPAQREVPVAPHIPARPTEILRESFVPREISYPGQIREVVLGATRSGGGSRSSSITIGGATSPAYADRLRPPVHPPAISLDVFDMKIALPKVLRESVEEVMEDPAEWARMNVNKFGADIVTIHLMSTDPLLRDATPAQAVKTVEDILQAVDVPLIIGGCGDPKKDAAVFKAVAEMADGERLLLNSVTLDMAEARTLESVATAARDHGHLLLAFTGLELNNAKELNRRLYEYIPPEQIVMDLTTVALGYGLEYSFTIHERARYAALMGDTELAHPVISAATNAWAAREAWMKMAPEYGPRELRGPVWETINALTLLLAGVDLFMMMHPASVLTLKDVIRRLGSTGSTATQDPVRDWVGVGNMIPAETPRKKGIREISPIDVYRLLPKTNCQECHESNCMAFATRLVNGELVLSDCPPLHTVEYREAHHDLGLLLAPPVKAVGFGTGDLKCTIGGKYVLQRHEFTYHNPPPLAIDVNDLMPEEELLARIRQIEGFSYNYIGRNLVLNAIAVRSISRDPAVFGRTVRKIAGETRLPLILCSLDPGVMEAGLFEIKNQCPLIYAATEDNWKPMADLALSCHAPLVVHSRGDLSLLHSLVKTLKAYGVSDMVLDPGALAEDGLFVTLHNFTALRTAACRDFDELSGFPLLGVPLAVWTGEEISDDVLKWRETITASMLISRYADLLIMHSLDGWVLLPQLIWRFNLYTDPRKPVSVEAGVRTFGRPDRTSPVLITTNYALTFFTVESDIKAANIDCYLIVTDTGGLSVESAVAGRYFTADSIAASLKSSDAENLVSHKTLIIPGLAARLSGDTEDTTGWKILVGPKDSSGLPQFIREHWPPS